MPEPVLCELTDEQRTFYFRGVQPIWGGGLAEDRFVAFQRRVADAPEAAQRYRLLGLVNPGESPLLAAMKAYELRGAYAGSSFTLLGIGAVFTPVPLRRRGHAARLLALAMAEYRARGAAAALLFSDIGAAYYERQGFRVLESAECKVEAAALPSASGFRSAAPGDEEDLSRLFAQNREKGETFTLGRDGWVLRFQLRRLRELARSRGAGEPEWGVRVSGRAGEAGAMLRQGRDTIDVLDAAWTSEAARLQLLGGLRDCLLRSGRPKLRLWPAHQLRGLFPAAQRTTAVAMIAPLREGAPLPPRDAPAELALLDHI